MSKIFTWVFGFVSGIIGGIIGGIVLLTACMVERPGDFVHMLLHLDSNTDEE